MLLDRRIWLSALSTLLFLPSALAQDASPEPGPEHMRLKELVGTWDTSMKLGDDESKGTMVFRMDLGGLWRVCDYQGDLGGQKFKGHGLDTYDPMSKKYVSLWADSMSTRPMTLEGEFDAKGKVLTMVGEGPGMDSKPTKYKMVFDFTSKDAFVQTMFGPGEDGKEAPMFVLKYTRRK